MSGKRVEREADLSSVPSWPMFGRLDYVKLLD